MSAASIASLVGLGLLLFAGAVTAAPVDCAPDVANTAVSNAIQAKLGAEAIGFAAFNEMVSIASGTLGQVTLYNDPTQTLWTFINPDSPGAAYDTGLGAADAASSLAYGIAGSQGHAAIDAAQC